MSELKTISFDDVDKASDIQHVYIDVKEWGGKLRLQSINAEDMMEFVESNEGPAKRTAGLRLIIKSAVTDDGTKVFKETDLQMLKRKNSSTCNRIVDAILELNGLKTKKQEETKND